ncbi:MAG TPA: PilZ domain-containing protein [Syntrophorhabdaceae bacterium]|nr:PilZ domain-containing protein [Syntrophorhabdaceae bacterium]HOD74850.1 PilZ domain-containing protein [Syntrophorhabdaceae bacterium]
MAADDKKSLIVLREKHQVDQYIREITGQSMPVRVVIDDTIVLDDCRLVMREGKRRDLFVEASLAPGEYPEAGRATITCAGDSSLYTFGTKVLSIELAEHRRMHLTIQYPDRITKRERRRHVRVRPSANRPVSARIVIDNDEVVQVEPVDISTGGISFMMTEEMSRFKSGDAVELVITVPAFGEVRAGATVRSVVHLMDLTRIGVEFSSLPDDALRLITEYVSERERQTGLAVFEDN